MKKLSILLMLTCFVLSGCGSAKTVNDYPFSMTFSQLNLDNSEAKFIVTGLPNEEEWNQIPTVIVDSLKAQNIKANTRINVSVTSESIGGQILDFGKCVYENGAIVENNLANIEKETYMRFIS